MQKKIDQEKKHQHRRDALLILMTAGIFLGGPVFMLQLNDYLLIQRYQREGEVFEATVTDRQVERYRWRSEYEIDVSYTDEHRVVFGVIDRVLHERSFRSAQVGDVVDILVLKTDPESPLLYQATTMEYWRPYFLRLIIAGVGFVAGILLFIYAFLTRKQAVERAKRLREERA